MRGNFLCAVLLCSLFFACAPFGAVAGSDTIAPPSTIAHRSEEVWRTLDSAGWVAERDASAKPNGKIVYSVAFRSCPTCAAFKAAEREGLLRAGVEIRWIMYARRDQGGTSRSKPGERAMVAELWLRRDAELMRQWWAAEDLDAFYASPGLPPLSDGDPRRMGALAQSRGVVDRLSGLFAENDLELAIPTLVWCEGGETKAYIGYSPEGFAPARAFLTAP